MGSMKTSSTDLLKHFSIGFNNVFGRDLSVDRPRDFEFLRSCWIARGHAAHGNKIYWISDGKYQKFFGNDVNDSFNRIESIIQWIKGI